MRNHSYEDALRYEIDKIAHNPEEIKKFFSIAIHIQNDAETLDYANDKFEFACEVLTTVGYCGGGGNNCSHCKLSQMHDKAVSEITENGRIRVRAPKKKRWTKVKDIGNQCPNCGSIICNGYFKKEYKYNSINCPVCMEHFWI